MPPHSADVHLRQPLPAGRHQHSPSTHLDYDAWAQLLIKTNHNSFGRHDADPKFGPWVRRPPPSPASAAELQNAVEEVAAFELSFRDIVESPQAMKTQPAEAAAVAAAEKREKKGKPRRESMSKSMGMTGLFLIKAFVPLVLAAVGGHQKIAAGGGGGGGVEKAAKVSPNPCQDKYDERSSSNGSSNHSGSSRNSGRRASCYLFLHRERSRPIEI